MRKLPLSLLIFYFCSSLAILSLDRRDSIEDLRGTKRLCVGEAENQVPLAPPIQGNKGLCSFSTVSRDVMGQLLTFFTPLERARLRPTCHAFRYYVDAFEYSGPLQGQLKAESLRKLFRVEVSFSPGPWNTDWGVFSPTIEYVVPGSSPNEQIILFSEKVVLCDQVVHLCEKRKVFEVLPGAQLWFTYVGLHERESFYTCRARAGCLGSIRRLIGVPTDGAFDIFHLCFSTSQEGVTCQGSALRSAKPQKQPVTLCLPGKK